MQELFVLLLLSLLLSACISACLLSLALPTCNAYTTWTTGFTHWCLDCEDAILELRLNFVSVDRFHNVTSGAAKRAG